MLPNACTNTWLEVARLICIYIELLCSFEYANDLQEIAQFSEDTFMRLVNNTFLELYFISSKVNVTIYVFT